MSGYNFGSSIEETQKEYQKLASSYNKECQLYCYIGPAKVAQRVADLFPKDVRDNVNILDVGAGTGLVAVEVRFMYYNALVQCVFDLINTNTYDVITGSGIYGEGAHVPHEALYEMLRLVKLGGYIILAARHELVKHNEIYKHLEPLMDKLETNRKWKKVSRDVFPKYNLKTKKDGVIWCYQVLEK
ncbi:uncharacterized protein LOC132741094 [Ruditapes philippinarum]|uniref:uncharacterized protein LOC132741094 n=1 Tax=Ruditapes philippinarum TaxID=129788 RepID=UPI00295B0028|nr:uncharacterized protein LOC132741094 [Ruditapes philippinarum]